MIQNRGNTDAEYHKENHQSPRYVDIVGVTYVTVSRMIGRGFTAPVYRNIASQRPI